MLREIVAGITDSVGRAALQAAFENGVTTGGFYAADRDEAPLGQPHPYGLRLVANHNCYGRRLMIPHIKVSDATLVFWDGIESPEMLAIRQAVEKAGKIIAAIILPSDELELPPLVHWLNNNSVEVLHIFGIARPVPEYEEAHPGVRTFMQELLQNLREQGQLYEPAIGESLWRSRWKKCCINRSVDSFAEFLEDPSEDNIKQLQDTALSLMMGQLFQATRSMPQAPLMGPQRGHYEIILAAHGDLCNRLEALLAAGLQGRLELLQGYRSSDPDQDFERYICAITVFHLWKSPHNNAEVRRHFSILLRHAFAPHLENSLIQWQRRRHGVENIVDCEEAIMDFLTENVGYLNTLMDRSFHDLRALFENRCSRRLVNVHNRDPINQAYLGIQYTPDVVGYDREADLQANGQLGNGPGGIVINEVLDLVEESRRSALLISREIYKIASSAITGFTDRSGRQLFLAMVLGGLSHRMVDRLRSSNQNTQYLVQPDFIRFLQNMNPNFVQQWFNEPMQQEVEFRNRIVPAMEEAAREFDLYDIHLERVHHIVENNEIKVWQIFKNLSNYVATEIQAGRFRNFNVGFNQEGWRMEMSRVFEQNNEDDDVGRYQLMNQPCWFAGFAKVVCENRGWDSEMLEW